MSRVSPDYALIAEHVDAIGKMLADIEPNEGCECGYAERLIVDRARVTLKVLAEALRSGLPYTDAEMPS